MKKKSRKKVVRKVRKTKVKRVKKIRRIIKQKKSKQKREVVKKMADKVKKLTFVDVVKGCLDKGINDVEGIMAEVKVVLPGLDEKKARSRVNPAIKYLGKMPVKKEKKVKEAKIKVVTPIVEIVKIDTSKGPIDTIESVTGPTATAIDKSPEVKVEGEKTVEGLGEIQIQ